MLIGPNGEPYASNVPGTVGGHRGRRIYGRFDCAAARRAIARGGYVSQRVFFLNEAHAEAAGYRPCGSCLPESYARWKQLNDFTPSRVRKKAD
jgi:methylphosphotriester-DNA--protein-cysteine methyltransferase